MRILFLTQTYPRFAGDTAGPFIRDLARGLVRGGDRVTVLTPHCAGLDHRWEEEGVETVTFRYAPERAELLGYSRSLAADERVRATAAAVAPCYALAAWRAVRRLRRQERFDLLHAHWVVPNGLIAVPGAGMPVAIGLHGSDVFLAERRGIRTLVRHALRRVRLVTGCSPELVERVCTLGFDRGRARVIPYGVDGEQFAPGPDRAAGWRRELGIPSDATLVLSVGRMVTKKGYAVLARALPGLLQRRPEVHVVLAGDGDLRRELERATGAWRERVHFPGAVFRDRLPDLYRSADLFVLPAVHDAKGNVDGLPNVILEAMASGLPVVASRISGIPLAVSADETGLLVPEGDAAALETALDRLAAAPALRRRMGAAGRRKAVAELSWDAVARRYRDAYEAALR